MRGKEINRKKKKLKSVANLSARKLFCDLAGALHVCCQKSAQFACPKKIGGN
jgi:hypothetical protein